MRERSRGQIRQGLMAGVLLLVALWITSLIWGLAGKARVAITEANDAQRQYRELEARRNELAANLAELATPRGQDAALRTAFGVAKDGEEVIVVVPPATGAATATPPWWRRILNWF